MASRGVNKVILIGNLGNDPDARAMPNGNAVSNFTVATSESWKDKNTGQAQERVEWHKIAAFGKLAEICNEYLRKGSKVYIEGALRTRKWEKDGHTNYTTEIIASEMQMLDSRGENTQVEPQPPQQQVAQHPPRTAPTVVDGVQQAPQVTVVDNDFDNYDDDIPF